MVELGPYPLCELCKQINGGLVAVRHRQVHLQVGDKQACVDGGLASVIATLWEVCETRSSCEDHDGRAFVVPSVETADSAERALAGLGVAVERADDGALYFRLPQRGNLPAPESADTSATPDHGDDGGFVAAIDRVTGVVAAVADRLDRNTVGIRHPRIGEARLRLDVALNRLEFAARRWRSVFRRPDNSLRVGGAVLQAGLLAGGCWTTAWAAGALTGGSPVATIVGGVLDDRFQGVRDGG